jgi:hypothetical protein
MTVIVQFAEVPFSLLPASFSHIFVMSSSSSSHDDIKSTSRTRRHKQRVNQGLPIRHQATPQQQAALLNTPTHQLDRNARRRQRRYREQLESLSRLRAQEHAQAVAQQFSVTSSSAVPPTPHLHQYRQATPALFPPFPPNTNPLNASPSSIPPFIPVAMIPSSYFPTMFPHITTPSIIPVVFSSHAQPIQPIVVQPGTAALSIMNQSDVDSPSVPQTSHQSSVTSSEMSSTPAKILVDMSGQEQTLTSTSALPKQATTSTSSSHVVSTEEEEEPFGDEPYLVHPVNYALAQSQLSWQTAINSPKLPSAPIIDRQQSNVYAAHLQELVLVPKQRIKYMQLIKDGKQGQYVSHWNMDSTHDISDIFSDILSTPVNTSSSSSISTQNASSSSDDPRVEHLRHILPFKLSTHTQAVFKQQLVDNKPTFSTHVYTKHIDAYKNLLRAHDLHTLALQQPHTIPDIKIDPAHHAFAPSIALHSIANSSVQQYLQAIAHAAQIYYQQRVKRLSTEVMCDHVFTPALDGFGVMGLQIYFKNGYCIAWIHDELLWSSALNYMSKNSVGCALWIGIGLHDLKQKMHMMEIDDWFKRDQPDLMKIGELLDALIASNTRVEYLFQRPGDMISSPPGMGAAHIVVTYGLFLTQLAWNFSLSLNDAITCLSFWGEERTDRQFGHLYTDNGSMATRSTLPLYTMEGYHYPFNLTDKMKEYKSNIERLQQRKHKFRIKIMTIKDKHLAYCPECLYRQDWIQVNNKCIHCYFKNPKVLKLLQ